MVSRLTNGLDGYQWVNLLESSKSAIETAVNTLQVKMILLRSIVFTAAILAMTTLAHAEKRVALVIGNSAYKNVARLQNPANDAAAVTAMLKSAGFDAVESRLDLNVGEMRRVLRDFGNSRATPMWR